MKVSHLALESKTDSNLILWILLLLCLKGIKCQNVFKVSEYLWYMYTYTCIIQVEKLPIWDNILNTYVFTCYESLHASGEFCRLPIAFCKQFEPRWRPTECRFWSRSKLFDSPMVVLCGLFVKTKYWRKSPDENKSMNNSLACKSVSTGRLQKICH